MLCVVTNKNGVPFVRGAPSRTWRRRWQRANVPECSGGEKKKDKTDIQCISKFKGYKTTILKEVSVARHKQNMKSKISIKIYKISLKFLVQDDSMN